MYLNIHAGCSFREFVRFVVQAKSARTYLEVGVCHGETLCGIDADSIGVDPNFRFTVSPIGAKRRLFLYQMPSDEFFRSVDVVATLGAPVDVAFLDGLHQFEYLLRDFINAERVASPDGVIMLDDCLPANAEMTERVHNMAGRSHEALASWWTGDVWKLVPILRAYRPDLRVTLVDTIPTGTVCVTGLNPASRVLSERYYEIVDAYRDVMLDCAGLEAFYAEHALTPSSAVTTGFDASLFVGP